MVTTIDTARDIETRVAGILEAAGIQSLITLKGKAITRQDCADEWECDSWMVSLRRANTTVSVPFYTGLGLRTPPKGMTLSHLRATYGVRYQSFPAYRDACTPKAPPLAAIINSMLIDGLAASMSFHDWCMELGYSEDSITDLNTYQACDKSWRQLLQVADRPTIEALREALQDY